MDADRWARIQDVFHQVADLPDADRGPALLAACGKDAALVREVQRLLDGDRSPAGLLDGTLGEPAAAVMGTNVPVHLVGPYRLTRILGEGGMGVVYHAERDDLASVAAVKLLRDSWVSPARRDRFVREQRTLAHLNHPGIAHLLDAGTLESGTPWIAMELVEGMPLVEYARQHHLSLADRLGLLRQVCDAVAYAHQLLVLHRDLKPSNILVRQDGVVKLLDFGIARSLAPDDDDAAITRTAVGPLTPAYASPEQVQGQPLGMASDVYSLGVILFELLTDSVPFDVTTSTPAEAERRIVRGDAPRPSSRRLAGLASDREWRDLDVICQTALHPDATRRYRTADALRRDLEHFLRGEPLEARDDTWRYRTTMFVRRHRRGVASTAIATVAAITLVTFYTVRLARARDAAVSERTRAERIQQFMTGLFRGRDEAAGPADSLRVVTLLDQGLVEARALDREPLVQADLYQTLGDIYRQLGQLERADSLLLTGQRAWQRLRGPSSDDAQRAALALADLRTEQANYGAADSLSLSALAGLRLAHGPDHPLVAQALVTRGRSLTERGEHDQAIVVLDSALRILAQRAPDTPEHLAALTELANARFYAGAYDAADSTNRVVLAMTRRLYGERHPLVAEDLMNLGATEQERGNYQSSERYFREALALTTSFYGEQHQRTAGNLGYLGRSLLLQNRYDEARDALSRALGIRERVYGANHPAVANTLNELGSLAVREERLGDAEAAYDRVLRIYTAAYPGRNFRVGVASGNLGDVFLNRKEYRRAETLYREALAHYIASQGVDHLNTGIGYIKLGRCLMRAGRFAEAEQETRRGYAVVAKVASPGVNFLQAARLDLSIIYDSLGRPDSASRYRAERERYVQR